MSKTIKHIDGNIGGYLVGRRHSEGGIKAINKSTNQPLEMEGGEVVITRNAVSDETKREFEGEMLTNKEILSRINQSGGGVSFEKGGEIHAYGNKFNYGGHLMSDHEILQQMAIGGQIEQIDDVDFDFEETEMALGGDTDVLLAPNGKPSNLSPEQYKLVRTPEFKKWFGDWENDPENSSKVIDENGEPLVVYRGYPKKRKFPNVFEYKFRMFDKSGLSGREKNEFAFYFTNLKKVAEKYGENFADGEPYVVKEYFLNIRNLFEAYNRKNQYEITFKELYDLANQNGKPIYELNPNGEIKLFLQKDENGEYKMLPREYWNYESIINKYINNNPNEIYSYFVDWDKKSSNQFFWSSYLRRYLNYDGLVFYETTHNSELNPNRYEDNYNLVERPWLTPMFGDEFSKTYGVFEPNQIKLADGTNTEFSSKSNDIRYEEGGINLMALGGALTSGLELKDLEGGAFIPSGNNYPPMKIINYNSFPIYAFIDYRDKKQKSLRKPLKLTIEVDGLISVYEYQHVSANFHDWVLIDNVDNISKLYEYLDSKYVNSSAIVVCNNEVLALKSTLQRRILDLLNEFSRYDDKRTSTRKGINKAIEEMETYQSSYINQGFDDFQNVKIKRVYFTQDIDWKNNSAIPKTDLDGYGMTDFFLIMNNRKQILTTLSRVKPSLTGKNHWNFMVIEFEDGRMRFDILKLKQNQNPINFTDVIDINGNRNDETITILTNLEYVNNSLAPDFVIQDSELADKQIKELPTSFSISLSNNNQTFQVGDWVKYIGADKTSYKNGDVGEIIDIPEGLNNRVYGVRIKGTDWNISSTDLEGKSPYKFQIGDEVSYVGTEYEDYTGLVGKVERYFYNNVTDKFSNQYIIKFNDGNQRICSENELFIASKSSQQSTQFKVGDKVKYIGSPIYSMKTGDVGFIIKIVNNDTYDVEFDNGRSYYINISELELYTNATNQSTIVNPNSIQQFHVGDEVLLFNESPNEIFVVKKCTLIDNKWRYYVTNYNKNKSFVGQLNENLVLADESSRYDNQFNIGDKVRVVYPNKDYFGNIGVVTNVMRESSQRSNKNPLGEIYSIKYELYGTNADANEVKGQWEGKDLILLESKSTQTATPPSTQPTQTISNPMTPSTNAGSRAKLSIEEQELQKQINDLTDLLNLIPEYDFEDKIAISQELTTLQDQMNVYVAKSTIQNEFINSGKIQYEQDIIDLMLSADCVKLNPRPTNTNVYQNGFSPSGKPTSLNKFNYDLIHTEQFRRWFGNYGLSYNYSQLGESNLGLSSKVVDENGEPLVVYMGVGREFEKITFNRFPIGYFAVNQAYAEWFATTKANDGVGYVLPFFLNIRRPLDFSMFGIDDVEPKDFFDWLYLETGMTGKELGFDDRWFLPNQPALKIWMYIRNCPNFLNKLKEYKICDGIHFYENNPANPVGSDNYMTEVWTIFYSNQCKLASENRSEMILSANNSFLMKKGGLVK